MPITRGSVGYILERRNCGIIALDDTHFCLICRSCITHCALDVTVRTSKCVFTNMIDAAFYADLENGRVVCNRCSTRRSRSPSEEAKWVFGVLGQLRRLNRPLYEPEDEYTLDMVKYAAAEQVWAEQYELRLVSGGRQASGGLKRKVGADYLPFAEQHDDTTRSMDAQAAPSSAGQKWDAEAIAGLTATLLANPATDDRKALLAKLDPSMHCFLDKSFERDLLLLDVEQSVEAAVKRLLGGTTASSLDDCINLAAARRGTAHFVLEKKLALEGEFFRLEADIKDTLKEFRRISGESVELDHTTLVEHVTSLMRRVKTAIEHEHNRLDGVDTSEVTDIFELRVFRNSIHTAMQHFARTILADARKARAEWIMLIKQHSAL
jgi:hypothetical protein